VDDDVAGIFLQPLIGGLVMLCVAQGGGAGWSSVQGPAVSLALISNLVMPVTTATSHTTRSLPVRSFGGNMTNKMPESLWKTKRNETKRNETKRTEKISTNHESKRYRPITFVSPQPSRHFVMV